MMRRVDAGLDPAETDIEIPEPQASDTELGAATNARSPQDYEGLLEGALTTDDVWNGMTLTDDVKAAE